MILSFLYIALGRLFGLAVLRLRSERTKDLEILGVPVGEKEFKEGAQN